MKKKSISFVVTLCLLMALLASPISVFGAGNSSCSSVPSSGTACLQAVTNCQKVDFSKVKKYRAPRKIRDLRSLCWKQTLCQNANQNSSQNTSQNSNPNSNQSTDQNAGTENLTSDLSAAERQVAELVNQKRKAQGLSALDLSAELSAVAEAKARDMAEKGYFSHTSPTYGSPSEMLKAFGLSYRTVGENIAKGYLTADSVMTGWMNSSGHRANILSSSYSEIGVGCVKDSKGTLYWVQIFRH